MFGFIVSCFLFVVIADFLFQEAGPLAASAFPRVSCHTCMLQAKVCWSGIEVQFCSCFIWSFRLCVVDLF
jgi:hypothetical protein